MIKFFRRIRRKLIDEWNLKRYLIYAIGEILLVVIGILIALQINNWSEGKKDTKKEYQILLSLSEDFNSNQMELNRSINEIPLRIERLKTVLSYVGKTKSQFTSEMKDTIKNTGFVLTDIIDGSLTSILSSDKLELIKSDSLKNMLTAYPAFIKKFKKQERTVEDYVINVQRFKIREYLTLTDLLSDNDPRYVNLKANVVKSDYEGLLNDREYQNILVGILITNYGLFNSGNQLKSKTEEIFALLRRELKRNSNYLD